MIPVEPKPEPPGFDELVRAPGMKFLETNPQPSSWTGEEHWRNILPRLYKDYGKICAYSAFWIPESARSVDHFEPKKKAPHKAYDWDNFRLVDRNLNARKGQKNIVDPFKIHPQTVRFRMDFTNMEVVCDDDDDLASKTIKYLKLNRTEALVDLRQEYVEAYRDGHVSFAYLKKKAPFIALELERQDLKDPQKLTGLIIRKSSSE